MSAACGSSHLSKIAPGEPLTADEDGVYFTSRGAVLVIGSTDAAIAVARRLAESQPVLACVSGKSPPAPTAGKLQWLTGRIASLAGHIGQFVAHVHAGDGGTRDLGLFSPNGDGRFDLVLDLGPTPVLTTEVKPLGYFAPPGDGIDAAIKQLRALTGSFRKPRYFRFDAGLCAHGAQSVRGCTRCLDVCPAGAIASAGNVVALDANLCQGCSTCMLVCPTGAVSHAFPLIGDVLPRIAAQHAMRRPGDAPHRVLLHQPDNANVPLAGSFDRQPLPAIAAVGIDTWLAALASGVSQVAIQLPADLTDSTRTAMHGQIALAQALLHAIGQPVARIATVEANGHIAEPPAANETHVPADDWPSDKAARLMAALRTLTTPVHAIAAPRDSVALPAGAPLGTLRIDRDACTMCMACANLCPTQALVASSGGSRLELVESRCVQCGICANGCPERAIALQPRFLLDADAREQPRTLNEAQRHACPECGAAFIGRAMLARSQQLMRDSGFLDDNTIDGLRLCPACRARALTR